MKTAINKFFNIKIIFLVLLFQSSFSQKKDIYICFDKDTNVSFLKEDGSGEETKEPIYIKNKQANGDILFLIKDHMFIYDKSKMSRRVIPVEKFNGKLLSADEIIDYVKTVRKKYPMWYKYPSDKYPTMYIVENSSNITLELYEVNWKYYIE